MPVDDSQLTIGWYCQPPTMWCPIASQELGFMVDISIVTMVYKPTCNWSTFQGVDSLRRATHAAQSPCFSVADAFHPPCADAEGCVGRWVARQGDGQELLDFNSSTDAFPRKGHSNCS